MDEFGRFSRLVLQIQEAALAPERWNAVVGNIVREAGGAEGILFSPMLPPSQGGFWASRALLPAHMEEYAAYYIHKDIWRLRAPKHLWADGTVYRDASFVPVEMLRNSEFYNDFLKRIELGRLLGSIVLAPESRVIPGGLHLSIFRPIHKEGFDPKDQQLLERLMPHLRAAIDTQYALGMRERASAMNQAVLNTLATAAFIVEKDGTVVFANEAAHRMVSEADGLSITKKLLAGATAAITASVRQYLASLFPGAHGGPRVKVLRIARPSGRKAYACFGQFLPVNGTLGALAPRPVAIVFVRDPEAGRALEPDVLTRLYGFTSAEAILAVLLARGLTLEKAAQERGIAYETARTQLKGLFMKTGSKRQPELVSLLLGTQRV